MRLKLRLFIVSLIVGMGLVKGQNLEYGVGVDTNYMMIGDQQHLTFRVRSDVPVQVVFPLLKDTVTAGVEIISGPVRDSLQGKDGKWLIEEKYVITAFDTGVYVIPAMPITVEDKSYNNVLRTDPIAFMVNTYKVDEQQGINDIVAPYPMPVTFLEVLPTILLVLVGVVVLALIVWFVIRRRKEKPLFRREEPAIPPYVRAIQALDGLKAEKLWQEGKVKEYYTRLTDTVRRIGHRSNGTDVFRNLDGSGELCPGKRGGPGEVGGFVSDSRFCEICQSHSFTRRKYPEPEYSL